MSERIVHVLINYNGPGVSSPQEIERRKLNRNPYDISTWGSECGRGIAYADSGAPVASGVKGVVRKISTGRKHRGMASDGVK